MQRDWRYGPPMSVHSEGRKGRLLHHIMEGRDYGHLKDLILDSQDGGRIASEKACKKPAGNSRRLKKKNLLTYDYHASSCAFLTPTVVGGKRPLMSEICVQSDPPLRKTRTLTHFRL